MKVKNLTATDVSEWRAKTELSQEEFGAMLGLSRATITRWESGKDEIPLWATLAHQGWRSFSAQGQTKLVLSPDIEERIREIAREEARKVTP